MKTEQEVREAFANLIAWMDTELSIDDFVQIGYQLIALTWVLNDQPSLGKFGKKPTGGA